MSFLFINKTLWLSNLKLKQNRTEQLEQLWMRKLQCLLFVWKRSYICNYIICMTVPLNKWVTFSSKSWFLSNKIEILSKLSKDTNEASSWCSPKPCLQYICSLVCDVIEFICDLKLLKAINRNYFYLAEGLTIIPRFINYDETLVY